MKAVPKTTGECKNRLLACLPEQDYQALRSELELVDTPLNFLLFERDQPIRYAYFPLEGEHYALAPMRSGAAVEVGAVGNEGFSTVHLLLGGEISPESTVCQIPGAALRMPASTFRALTLGDTPLRRLSLRYLQAYLRHASQSVACNAVHNIGQRMARWLLLTQDRMQDDEIPLKQEYIAMMLGVQRPSVSVAAKSLQDAGLIRYSRGHIRVIDRQGLEAVACECYAITRSYYRGLQEEPSVPETGMPV